MGLLHSLSLLFFPRQCPVCGKVLVKGEKLFCTQCLAEFPWCDPDFPDNTDNIRNIPEDLRPDKIYSLFRYSKGADTKNLLFAIKYRNRPDLALELGNMLGKRLKDTLEGDLIIPVPLHPKRLRQRGYNQSSKIAEGISEATGIPFSETVVSRIVNTSTQTGKNAEERFSSLNGAFRLDDENAVRGKHIIIADDVITTGATAGSCLKTISAAGKVRFTLVCIARTSL